MARRKTKSNWSFWKVLAVVMIIVAAIFLINWYTIRVFGWDMLTWALNLAHNPPDMGGGP